ncbi:hypothetical protein V8G54_027812 [Vigna mungo]|uniref:Suppressor of white apricot N-terminal domain-containing protein n=1 Tax=Vigna mungo TaxID=3915 RepID=A0AAQ3MRF8_VIGMU
MVSLEKMMKFADHSSAKKKVQAEMEARQYQNVPYLWISFLFTPPIERRRLQGWDVKGIEVVRTINDVLSRTPNLMGASTNYMNIEGTSNFLTSIPPNVTFFAGDRKLALLTSSSPIIIKKIPSSLSHLGFDVQRHCGTTGKSVISEGYLPAAFRPSKSLSPLLWSFRHCPKPNLVTLSHCDVANVEAGSLMAITLWFVWLGFMELAAGWWWRSVGSALRFDGASLVVWRLTEVRYWRFIGLKREVAGPRQFEAVAVSDADGGSLVAGLRLGSGLLGVDILRALQGNGVGFRCRTYRDDALYQATQDQQGCSFDGRALLDFIRDSSHRRTPEKSEEEEELEEFVNFVRYWDLVKHRGKGCRYFLISRQCPSASKGSYSQIGFSYDGNGKEETHISEDDDEDFNSDDSNNEGMEIIAKEYGVKRYG